MSNEGGTSPHWFIYRADGPPIGPLPTEIVSEAILAGTFSPGVYVAAPGGDRWLRALDVPNIARLIQGQPTRRRPNESGMREVHRKFDETEVSPAAPLWLQDNAMTSPLTSPLQPEALPETQRAPSTRDGVPAPSSSSPRPYEAGETLGARDDVPRKRTQGG